MSFVRRRSSAALTDEDHEKIIALAATTRIRRFEWSTGATTTTASSLSSSLSPSSKNPHPTSTASSPPALPLSLDWDQIEVGKVIGTGSFSVVRKAYLKDSDDPQLHDRTFAIKSLRPDVIQNKKEFAIGAIDLALEAKILSHVSHKHIVGLMGVKSGALSEALSTKVDDGFFLLEEYLVDTLDKRIFLWRKEEQQNKWNPFHKKVAESKLLHRLETVALGVASAMEYLHKHDIIFRDLKPANIGFAEDDSVRLFDFGLARELGGYVSMDEDDDNHLDSTDTEGRQCHPTRRLTGHCGTPRYMAPEVAGHHSDHYGLPADIYSFAILLWELITLKKPFDNVQTLVSFHKEVFKSGTRPSLSMVRSKTLRKILERAWSGHVDDRPSFTEIRETLEMEIDMMKGVGHSSKGNLITKASSAMNFWCRTSPSAVVSSNTHHRSNVLPPDDSSSKALTKNATATAANTLHDSSGGTTALVHDDDDDDDDNEEEEEISFSVVAAGSYVEPSDLGDSKRDNQRLFFDDDDSTRSFEC